MSKIKEEKSSKRSPDGASSGPHAHDVAILKALLKDSRRTLQDIGAEVGLAQTTVWNRIRQLEATGVIEGYTVKTSLEALGYEDTVIVQVNLESHDDEMLYKFGQALETIPEVLEAYLVSGDYDYFIRIAVKNTRDYERLLRERLYKIPGIRHSKSSFVLRRLKKSDTPLV